jgi:hypothetical protein
MQGGGRHLSWSFVAPTAGVLLALARPCPAADPEEVYQSALADLKADNPGACPKFAEARRLRPDSTAALLGLAQCYEHFGKNASAWGKYRELIVELKAQGEAAKADAATRRAADLAQMLSTVVLVPALPDTPGLIVRLDAEDVPRAMFGTKMNVDPGAHTLEATAPEHEVWRATIKVGEAGDTRVVQVPALAAVVAPPAAGSHPFVWTTQRLAGTGMVGVGLLGLGAGGALGGLAISKNNASKVDCGLVHTDVCNPAGVSLRGTAGTLANASTGALIAGAAVAAGGIAVFLTSPSDRGPRTGLRRIVVSPLASMGTAGAVLHAEW